MFSSNPFAQLSASIPPAVMQAYVVLMIALVAAGTLFDVVHKGSARYFFENWRKSKGKGAKPLGSGEMVSIAVKTGVVDVLASGGLCNARRRIAHLLGMYGFVIYVVATAVLIFGYPTPATSAPALPADRAVVDRRPDGLRRRVLVLVLHPRRRRRRRQVAAAPDARGPVHTFASRQRDAGAGWAFLQSRGTTGAGVVLACSAWPRRCCSQACRGPSSPTCSTSPRRPSRSGYPRPTARRNLPTQTRDTRATAKILDGTAARRPDEHGPRHQARSAPPLLIREAARKSCWTR